MRGLKHQHQDEFEKSTIATPNGRPLNAYLIRCGKCGGTDKISLPNNGPMPPDMAARRFEAKGWDTSKGRRDRDVCPKCSSNRGRFPGGGGSQGLENVIQALDAGP